ncbi:MAG: lipoprotein [Ectothiorhodospiraceae bacterium]|nr:lipoprotein [Ectothiorhodospiraceae bacterium]
MTNEHRSHGRSEHQPPGTRLPPTGCARLAGLLLLVLLLAACGQKGDLYLPASSAASTAIATTVA